MTTTLHDIAETSRRVADTSARNEKVALLAERLRALAADGEQAVRAGVAWLTGQLRQGRIGVGYRTLQEAFPGEAASSPTMTMVEADATFERIAGVSGAGSTAEKLRLLRELLVRATREEQRFLVALLSGELRQGALEGVLVTAVAKAAKVKVGEVRRALMLAGDLGEVAATAFRDGAAGLAATSIRLFRPLQPMLAQTSESVGEALGKLERAAFEAKLDGARIQVHKSGDEVQVFTRNLKDVTGSVPEVVEQVRGLPARSLILDGEVLALDDDGSPLPFQTTMRRFGRKLDVEAMRAELPLSPAYFDCLLIDGQGLIDEPTDRRRLALEEALPEALWIPRLVTADAREAQAFLSAALERGFEGAMAKALDAPYEAGKRGKGWLKLKPTHTLDLVVLAAEWGHGRRKGWLSNLHLGARDPEGGGFVMLGKTFKGLTDETLAWQTERLQQLEVARDDWTVHVRPELVVEIAFNDVQESPQYPGGVALRHARVKRYRPDKAASEADTIEAVRAIHAAGFAGLA